MTTGHGMCARLTTGLIVRKVKTDRNGLGGKNGTRPQCTMVQSAEESPLLFLYHMHMHAMVSKHILGLHLCVQSNSTPSPLNKQKQVAVGPRLQLAITAKMS